jgi:hypothetical protein
MTEQDWAHFDAKEWAMGHEKLCTSRWETSNNQLNLIIRILFGMIATVVAVFISFAGYQYVTAQGLAEQLAASRAQTSSQISQIPSKTAQAVSATQGASHSGD